MKAITLQDFFEEKSKGSLDYKRDLKEKQKVNSFETLRNNIKANEIVVIASRPGEGKTNFMYNLLINQVAKKNEKVLLFSVRNNSITNLANLIDITENIGVKTNKIFNNILFNSVQTHSTNDTISFIIDALFQNPDIKAIYLDDIHELSWYYHLFEYGEKQYYELAEDIGNCDDLGVFFKFLISISLKYQIPIFLTAEIKRESIYRSGNKRPRLSDIRIERLETLATKILFIHKPLYHGISEDVGGNSNKGLLEVIIAKNKNGRAGKILRLRAGNMVVSDIINTEDSNIQECDIPF